MDEDRERLMFMRLQGFTFDSRKDFLNNFPFLWKVGVIVPSPKAKHDDTIVYQTTEIVKYVRFSSLKHLPVDYIYLHPNNVHMLTLREKKFMRRELGFHFDR